MIIAACCVVIKLVGGDDLHLDSAKQRHMRIVAENLNFGEAHATHEFKWTFTVRNLENERAQLALVPSCRCTSIRPKELVIPPMGAVDVEAELDLWSISEGGTGQLKTDASVAVHSTQKGEESHESAVWRIQGTILRPLAVTPRHVFVSRNGSNITASKCKIVQDHSIANVQAVSDDPRIKCSVTSNAADSEGCYLDISMDASFPEGRHSSVIRISGYDDNGHQRAEATIQVTAIIEAELRAEPAYLSLGKVKIGELCKRPVKIDCISPNSCKISDIACAPNDGFEIAIRCLDSIESIAWEEGKSRVSCEIALIPKKRGFFVGIIQLRAVLHDGGNEDAYVKVGFIAVE
jgi:hypothetical protein